MSINSAMLAGVTGLTANASALAATSDNIANVNTVGYKRNQTEFSDLVTATSNSNYSAGGVQALTHQYVSQQGLLQASTSTTDLAISGQGFFVTTDKPENITPADTRLFTRAGSFTKDNLGYLRNSAGLYLQGWPANSSGVIATDPSDITKLKSINVSAVGGAAEATTRAGINANLQASQPIQQAVTDMAVAGPPADAYSPTSATTSMASGGTVPDFSVQVALSDSKGGARSVMIDFLKSATPNQWYAEMRAVPASDVVEGAGLNNGQIATGIVAFTPDGRLDAANTTLVSAANPSISFGASGAAPAAGKVSWATALGINAQPVTFDLANAAGGLTQYDSASIVQSVNTNGTAFGNLTSIQIDDKGFVTAIFDNGVTRKVAQVAIATFPNVDGLKSVNGDAYSVSIDSGTYNFKTPGAGGAGSIAPSTLESSTVDLSSEFSGLITTQRAYSASSKIITTADSMLQELINIIR